MTRKKKVSMRRRLMSKVTSGLTAWRVHRRAKLFLAGMPAVLAACTFLAIPSWQLFGMSRLASVYRAEFRSALARKDFESAEVYLRRLMTIQGPDLETRHGMALVVGEKGRKTLARKMIHKLAPATGVGYPLAHMRVANEMISDYQGKKLDAQETGVLLHHLTAALRGNPPPAEAHRALGKIFLQAKQFEKAAEHLERAARTYPQVYLMVAEIYGHLGNSQPAEQAAKKAENYFQARAQEDPTNVHSQIGWARACELQNHFSDSEKILLEALKMSPDQADLRDAMAALYVNESDRHWRPGDVRMPERRLELLQNALKHSRNKFPIFERLVTLLLVEGPVGDFALRSLERLTENGEASATIYLALGTFEAGKADRDKAANLTSLSQGLNEEAEQHQESEKTRRRKAEQYFAEALKLNPDLPIMLNNFAWVLFRSEAPDLARALELADRAVQLSPNDPRIRDTRGQILAKLRRWEDALADLEIALKYLSGNHDLHVALAVVYGALDEAELAELHQSRAATPRTSPGSLTNPPAIVRPLPNLKVELNAPNTIIDLASHFDDHDANRGDSLRFSVVANSNQELVKTAIDGSELTLEVTTGQSGTATISIRATERAGLTVDEQFQVHVGPPSTVR